MGYVQTVLLKNDLRSSKNICWQYELLLLFCGMNLSYASFYFFSAVIAVKVVMIANTCDLL